MSGGQQNALAAAVRGQAPPTNPQTPAQRTDPKHDWLIALQRVRVTLRDIVDQHLDNQDPATQSTILAMHGAIDKLLAGIDAKTIAVLAAASLVKSFDPQTASMLEMRAMQMSQPPMVPGAPAITPPGGMSAPTAGPQATPPPGAPQAPVSPGNFPG